MPAKKFVAFTPGLSEMGGAAKQTRLLLESLEERGWEILVVARAGTLLRFRWWRKGRMSVLEIPGFNRPVIGAFLFVLVALTVGATRRPQAYLGVQVLSPAMVAGLCGSITRRPFLVWSTTSGPFSEVRHSFTSRTAGLRKKLLSKVAFAVAQSEAVATELREVVPESRVVVLPNPVDLVDSHGLSGRPHVLYTGRFSEEKDLPRLLDAWQMIAEEFSGARLTLVGAGGHFRSIEALLRHQVEESPSLRSSVVLPGWVSDVRPYLADADVFVLPSLTEGMSNALIEACAWGRVVVASDIGANVAVVGPEYPLLFKAGNTDSLVGALRSALTDDEVRARARASVLERSQDFKASVVAERWEELIFHATDSSRY